MSEENPQLTAGFDSLLGHDAVNWGAACSLSCTPLRHCSSTPRPVQEKTSPPGTGYLCWSPSICSPDVQGKALITGGTAEMSRWNKECGQQATKPIPTDGVETLEDCVRFFCLEFFFFFFFLQTWES